MSGEVADSGVGWRYPDACCVKLNVDAEEIGGGGYGYGVVL